MRTYKNKGQLLIILLVAGFLIGILYANLVAGDSIMLSNIFKKTTLQYFKQAEIVSEKYFLYVLRERIMCLIFICFLSCIKWKKIYVGIVLGTTGFLSGVLMVAAVLQLGIKGILLCIAGMLPHTIFYGFAYGILLWHWYRYPSNKWNKAKTIFAIVMFGAGAITEVYLNPWLVKGVIGII